MNYVPISFKSDYSLLKSLLKIGDIVKYSKENNSSYAGVLDDNPYAIMDFYDKCEKNNLKNDKKLTLNDLFKYNAGLICVLPCSDYRLFNRLKAFFEVYLGYTNNTELTSALLIHKQVVFINEIQSIKKEEVNLLKILYKIAGVTYEGSNNYVLPATEFDVQTIRDFQEKRLLQAISYS